MTPRLRANLPLGLVLLLALALRVWGLAWGLPSATHYFSYHPDESVTLLHAMQMNLFTGNLLPHFYNYGSLQLYLVLFANTLDTLFGHGSLGIHDYAVQHAAWARQYLVGRELTVGMGVGSVWATYAVGARLWGPRAGIAAALILAVMPLHAQHSHWLTVDVPATFWAMLSLVWSARLATGDPKPGRAAIWAGVFAGLAAATKYNLALTLLPLLFALAWPSVTVENKHSLRRALGLGAIGIVACVGAFLLACPGFLLESPTFWHDFHYEAYHVQHLPDLAFEDTGNGFVYQIGRNLDDGLGFPLLLLTGVSVIWAVMRREWADGLLAVFALPYFVLISLVAVRYARYSIPLLPILALWNGRLLGDLSRLPRPAVRSVGLAAAGAVLLFTLWDCIWLIRPMAAPDNRDVALAQLEQRNVWPVGFAAQPWFGTPPVSPWFCAPFPGFWKSLTPPARMSRMDYVQAWDTAELTITQPPVVVLSETDYADALRLRQPNALAYVQALRDGYTLRYTVTGPDAAPAMVDGLPTRGLPPDMLYPDPVILIFVRK